MNELVCCDQQMVRAITADARYIDTGALYTFLYLQQTSFDAPANLYVHRYLDIEISRYKRNTQIGLLAASSSIADIN